MGNEWRISEVRREKNMASLFSSMYICLQKLYTHIMIFCACSVYTIHILPTRVPVLIALR